MGGIFISYRREDAAGHAGRLFDRLSEHFGRDRVFMDVSDIEPGVDFVEAIERAVGSCEILVVVIGRDWLKATDAAGKRRLDDPRDFIRLEVGAALKRDIRVIPVLVRGAGVPALETLPDDLEKLARRNAVELSDNRWDSDVREFIKLLDHALGQKPRGQRKVLWPAASAAAAVLITLAAAYFSWPLLRGLTQSEPVSPSAIPPAKIEATPSSKPEVTRATATRRPVQLPAATSVNVADVNYKILSAELDSHADEKLALTFLIRMTNNRNYPRNFWDNSFRLQVNDVPQAPVGGLNELVEGKSAKEGLVLFVIADKTSRAKLRIESEGESAEIPLELGAASSVAAAPPASQPAAPPPPQPAAPSPALDKKPEAVPVRVVAGPALVSPAHNAMLDNGCKAQLESTAWDFSWAKVAGASRYHLYVAAPNAKNPTVNQPDLSTTSYRHEWAAPSHVADRTRKGWQWKVRAQVGDDWGEWSKTRTFDVEPLDTDCKTVAAAETSALPKPSQPLPPAAPVTPDTLRPAEVKSTKEIAQPPAKEPSEPVAPPPEKKKEPSGTVTSAREKTPPTPEKVAVAPPSTSRPGMPKVGDTWTYRYTSGWRGEKEKTFVHKIVGLDPIKEAMSLAGADSETHTFNDAVELVNRRVSNAMRQEFSPFLQAFTALEAGKSWKNIPAPQDDAIVYPWSVQAKVVGPEPVSVPAGKFNAIKVELWGNRTADVSRAQAGSVAVRSKQVIWYAPEVKRIVKHTRNTFASNGNDLDKDIYELTEYRLN
ncbi:MAG: TIR domain-containing protein [Burkholderiales bacterium]